MSAAKKHGPKTSKKAGPKSGRSKSGAATSRPSTSTRQRKKKGTATARSSGGSASKKTKGRPAPVSASKDALGSKAAPTTSGANSDRALRHEVALDPTTGEEYNAPYLQALADKDGSHPAARAVSDLSAAGRLACPACGNRIKAVLGSEKRWHFALAGSSMECSHEPESVAHRATKTELYRHLSNTLAGEGWRVHCEKALENGRRPDILLVHPGGSRVAVEVQYADISSETLDRRRSDYAALGVGDIWLLGHSRLESKRDLLARMLADAEDQRVVYASDSRITEIMPSHPTDGMDRPEDGWSYKGKRRTRKSDYALRRATVVLDEQTSRPKWRSPADAVFEEIRLRAATKRTGSRGDPVAGYEPKGEPASRRWSRIRDLTGQQERLLAGGRADSARAAELSARIERARAEDARSSGYDHDAVYRELLQAAPRAADATEQRLQRLTSAVIEDTGADWAIYCASVRWKLPLAAKVLSDQCGLRAASGGQREALRKIVSGYPHDRTRAIWAAEAFLGRLRRSL